MSQFDPPHYRGHPSGVECIEIAGCLPFALGNAVKYLWRVDDKDTPASNIGKAIWYVNHEIQRRYSTAPVTRFHPLPRQFKETVPVVLKHEDGWRREVLGNLIDFPEYEPKLMSLIRAKEILEKVQANL